MIVSRLAHLALGVPDPEAAAGFYEEVFGLSVIGESGDGLYLACGCSNTFELHLREGDAELDHFALSVLDRGALELARVGLAAAGAPVAELDLSADPGLEAGIETVLPAGHAVRLVLESDPRPYTVTASVPNRHRRGIGPVALEHVTLLCDEIRPTAEFLVETLGLRISDSVQPPGEPWRNTHLRAGVLHHDVGLLPDTESGLHHFAFAVPSSAQIVAAADAIVEHELPLEASMGRHVAGNNIFIYFRDRSGHRVEVNTDMARADQAAPPKIVPGPLPFDAWRPGRPPALQGGTRLRVRQAGAAR